MDKRKIERIVPLKMLSENRAKRVSLLQRFFGMIFGSPNARRANGIIYSGCDICGHAKGMIGKLFKRELGAPVFEIDRVGTLYSERLPRIWLSEEMFNTGHDGEKRIFVECYPNGPDKSGARALELGERYIHEGVRAKRCFKHDLALECFRAAEILLLHALKRGNEEAPFILRDMYARDLCKGQWYESRIFQRAKHAREEARA